MTLDEITKALQGRNVNDVAAATGLHYNTVWMIAKGRHKNPTLSTVTALTAYLGAHREA